MNINTIVCKHDNATRVGPYSLLETIASGGFGCTFVAQHIWMPHRIFAVKILQEKYRASQEERDRFFHEASLLEQLEHPHIVHLNDANMDCEIPYIVMEYLPNGTLQDRIDHMGSALLPIPEALKVIEQLGQALDYLHKRGIVHRDLKPANIGLDEKGDVKLLDFGIAEILGTMEVKEIAVIGSLFYMAPEQLVGYVCRESDQFVLACLTYELLTGYRPFLTDTTLLGRYQQLQKRPVSPRYYNSKVPFWIEEALLKAMDPNRLQRHHDVSTFIAALSEPNIHTRSLLARQKSKEYWVHEGNGYYEMGRYELALVAFNHALELDSRYALAYNNKGATFYRLQRYVAALTAFNKALYYAPHYAVAAYWRAMTLERLRRVEAQQAYRKAYRLGYR